MKEKGSEWDTEEEEEEEALSGYWTFACKQHNTKGPQLEIGNASRIAGNGKGGAASRKSQQENQNEM